MSNLTLNKTSLTDFPENCFALKKIFMFKIFNSNFEKWIGEFFR